MSCGTDNPTAGALRNRRYRARVKRRQAVGRFLITERLISRLVLDGEISEAEALTMNGVETGVARVLMRYSDD